MFQLHFLLVSQEFSLWSLTRPSVWSAASVCRFTLWWTGSLSRLPHCMLGYTPAPSLWTEEKWRRGLQRPDPHPLFCLFKKVVLRLTDRKCTVCTEYWACSDRLSYSWQWVSRPEWIFCLLLVIRGHLRTYIKEPGFHFIQKTFYFEVLEEAVIMLTLHTALWLVRDVPVDATTSCNSLIGWMLRVALWLVGHCLCVCEHFL